MTGPTTARVCRSCHQEVGTYRPTGAPRELRAVRHPDSAYTAGGYQCPGSFGATDTAAEAARDAERTARWRTAPRSGDGALVGLIAAALLAVAGAL